MLVHRHHITISRPAPTCCRGARDGFGAPASHRLRVLHTANNGAELIAAAAASPRAPLGAGLPNLPAGSAAAGQDAERVSGECAELRRQLEGLRAELEQVLGAGRQAATCRGISGCWAL